MSIDDVSPVSKKPRRSNFTNEELAVLVEEVGQHFKDLFGAFTPFRTAKTKAQLWQSIADKINAVCAANRDGVEVRKKWNDYKCQVKKKSSAIKREQRQTGGGAAPVNLSQIEEKVLTLIPACQVEGVEGGIELGFVAESPTATSMELKSLSWFPPPPSSSSLVAAAAATTISPATIALCTTSSPTADTTIHATSLVTSATLSEPATTRSPAASTATSTSLPSHGKSAKLIADVASKETKSKGKRKPEVTEETALDRLVAVETKKVKILEELTTTWKAFFASTKTYQERDLAIKEQLLHIFADDDKILNEV